MVVSRDCPRSAKRKINPGPQPEPVNRQLAQPERLRYTKPLSELHFARLEHPPLPAGRPDPSPDRYNKNPPPREFFLVGSSLQHAPATRGVLEAWSRSALGREDLHSVLRSKAGRGVKARIYACASRLGRPPPNGLGQHSRCGLELPAPRLGRPPPQWVESSLDR